MATQTRLPTGAGVVAGFTSSVPGDPWLDVNDPVGSPNDATDYIFKADGNANHSFTFSAFSVTAGATVNSVASKFRSQRTAAGACSLGGRLRIAGTNIAGTAQSQTTSWADYSQTHLTNPVTGIAWTVDDVNGTGANPLQEFGLTGSGLGAGEEAQCTQVYLEADYTEAAGGLGIPIAMYHRLRSMGV